jgi:hypothetical protein
VRLSRDVTPKDLTTLRAYLKARPQGRRDRRYEYLSYACAFSVVGFGILAIVFARSGIVSPWLFVLSPAIGVPLWHPLWLYLDRRGDRRLIEFNASLLGPQEFWTSDEGFGNKTAAGSTFHVWKEVLAVEEAADLVFVSARHNFYSIPRRGRPDVDVDQFVADLRRRWPPSNHHAVEQRDEADEARDG